VVKKNSSKISIKTGVMIKCWLRPIFESYYDDIKSTPYAIINGQDKRELRWNEYRYIPLEPDTTHKIQVMFNYLDMPDCSPSNSIEIKIKKGIVKYLAYKPGWDASSDGKLKRIKPNKEDMHKFDESVTGYEIPNVTLGEAFWPYVKFQWRFLFPLFIGGAIMILVLLFFVLMLIF